MPPRLSEGGWGKPVGERALECGDSSPLWDDHMCTKDPIWHENCTFSAVTVAICHFGPFAAARDSIFLNLVVSDCGGAAARIELAARIAHQVADGKILPK